MKLAVLEMGHEKYGDCLYLDLDGFTVLIDGGRPGDYQGGANLPRQLKSITNKSRWDLDLLVVTHSHNDHVGCLPELVEAGDITAKMALVSDPDDRYGPPAEHDALTDGLPPSAQAVLDMIGEELPDPGEADFDAMVDAMPPVQPRYRAMIKTLGAGVVRYMTDPITRLNDFIRPHGLKVLGPTRAHINLCAKRLKDERERAAGRLHDALSRDATLSKPDLLRLVLGADGRDALDASKKFKGAINDLSIIIMVEASGKKILLPGDMQFADAEVEGLATMMGTLLRKVSRAGPYDVVKIPHHTSKNAWSEEMHRTLLNAPILIHSGGLDDATHPEKKVLEMMEQFSAGHTFLRNDRNGLIQAKLVNGQLDLKYSGNENDFTPNTSGDASREGAGAGTVQARASTPSAARISTTSTGEIVRVTAEIPHTTTTVSITIEVEPKATRPGGQAGSRGGESLSPAGTSGARPGRKDPIEGLDGLLFLTNEERLRAKIGDATVDLLEQAVAGSRSGWSGELPSEFSLEAVRAVLETELSSQPYKGVVLLGDYDVIPAARFDCLPPEVRSRLSPGTDDPDNFIVWSDNPYGDRDNDGIQEVPVSRVPDGGAADFLVQNLVRRFRPLTGQYTLRNVNRPFADLVQGQLPGTARDPEQSEPVQADDVNPENLRGAYLYFMLHGSDFDAARFWGEEEDSYLEAMNVNRLPANLDGAVVFAGCCWGALISREPAYRIMGKETPSARQIENSIALSCLRRGASAFIGCTGAHYSPLEAPYNYFGHPMHTHFWNGIREGQAPARALFEARQQYLRNLPHRTPGNKISVDELAIELKIYHQFTCLGLGW
jgi:hypothetical protein